MHKHLYLIILVIVISACNTNVEKIEITRVDNTDIDSLSIRALEVRGDSEIFFTASKSTFGYSNNGGETWKLSKINNLNQEFRSLAVLKNAVIAINTGSPTIVYRSEDLGESWKVCYTDTSSLAFYNSVKFWDNNNGIASGDPQTDGCLSIIRTSDGGNTWSKISCDNLPQTDKGEAQFAASNTCIEAIDGTIWIATGGINARILKSTDNGDNWKIIEPNFTKGKQMTGIYSVDFFDKNHGFITGGDWNNMSDSLQNKYYTTDGGESWNEAKGEDIGYRSCVQYVPNDKPSAIMSIGIPGISISNDKGLHWKKISYEENFYTIRFVNDNTAWAAGKGKLAKLTLIK